MSLAEERTLLGSHFVFIHDDKTLSTIPDDVKAFLKEKGSVHINTKDGEYSKASYIKKMGSKESKGGKGSTFIKRGTRTIPNLILKEIIDHPETVHLLNFTDCDSNIIFEELEKDYQATNPDVPTIKGGDDGKTPLSASKAHRENLKLLETPKPKRQIESDEEEQPVDKRAKLDLDDEVSSTEDGFIEEDDVNMEDEVQDATDGMDMKPEEIEKDSSKASFETPKRKEKDPNDKHQSKTAESGTPVEDIDDLITLQSAVNYLGFVPSAVRVKFIEGKDPHDLAKDLIRVFTAYAHIGNNISNLKTKRVGLEMSSELAKNIQSLGIEKKTTKKDGLTLPRLAIAFMPEYLIYRRFFSEGLQTQTESSVDVCYQDIVFYGFKKIRDLTGYNDFHKEFSNYIYKGKEEVEIDDKTFLASQKKFQKVSIAGFGGDTAIHSDMDFAFSAGKMTKREVYDWIVNQMVEHLAALSSE